MIPVSATDGEISSGKPQRVFYYGWVVLAVCLLMITVCYGIRFSFGVFFKSLEEDFGWTRALTSSVFSVYMLVCVFFTIGGGWVTDRYGGKIAFLIMGVATFFGLMLTSRVTSLWQIYLSYGVLVALGTGPIYAVSMSLVNRWFEQRRALALAIVTSGVGLGSILMTPVTSILITSYDWRTSYVIVAFIALIVMVPGALLLRMPPRKKTVAPKVSEGGGVQNEELSVMQILKTRNFILLFITWIFYSYCLFTMMAHIVRHAVDLNIAPLQAASIVSMSGFANIPMRIAMGLVSDRYSRRLAALISAVLMTVSFLWLTQATNLWMLYVFAIVFGASYGGLAPPTTAIAGDTFGIRHIGLMLGLLDVGWTIGSTVGPAVAGYIFDTTGSYSLAFWLCAVAAVMVVVLVLFLQVKKVGSK